MQSLSADKGYVMSINHVQFQKGLSLADFMERYGTQAQCHAALVASGFVCPHCASTRHCTFERKGWQYTACGKQPR